MADQTDIIQAIQGATDAICECLKALTAVIAATAYFEYYSEGTSGWRVAFDTLDQHLPRVPGRS